MVVPQDTIFGTRLKLGCRVAYPKDMAMVSAWVGMEMVPTWNS